jgi:hypothetical protein
VLFVHANDTHENFRLATAPLDRPGEWTTLIEGSDEFYLTGFELFRDFYVIDGRLGGLDRIEVRYYDDPARIEPVEFPEASYTASLGNNPEFGQSAAAVLREHGQPGEHLRLPCRRAAARTAQGAGNPLGLRPRALRHRAARDHRARRHAIPVSIMYRKDRASGAGAAAPLRLRRLRHRHPAGLLDHAPQPGRPRLRLCHRAYPRRRRPRTRLVQGGQARKPDQHLHRLRRRGEGAWSSAAIPRPGGSRSRAARPAAS